MHHLSIDSELCKCIQPALQQRTQARTRASVHINMTPQTTTHMQADNLDTTNMQATCKRTTWQQPTCKRTTWQQQQSLMNANSNTGTSTTSKQQLLGQHTRTAASLLHIAGPISVLKTQKSMFSMLHSARQGQASKQAD